MHVASDVVYLLNFKLAYKILYLLVLGYHLHPFVQAQILLIFQVSNHNLDQEFLHFIQLLRRHLIVLSVLGDILNQERVEAHFLKQLENRNKFSALDLVTFRNSLLYLSHELDQRHLAHQSLVSFAGSLFLFNLFGSVFHDFVLKRVNV